MPRTASPLMLATAGAGISLSIFGVLALGSSGHAEALITKPLPAKSILQDRAPVLPLAGARQAQDRSGRMVRVVYPGTYARP